MARFQILSLAGGGIRGAFITSFFNDLEQRLGRPIAESFDLIAGTSTGGIIAAGLAMGLPASKMHDFYVRHGAGIFSARPPYRGKGLMRFLFSFSKLGIQTQDWQRTRRGLSFSLLPACAARSIRRRVRRIDPEVGRVHTPCHSLGQPNQRRTPCLSLAAPSQRSARPGLQNI